MSAALDRPRHPILRGALVGAGLGVVWGVGVRVFMRLVSDNPSFSWVGTLFILGLAALLGGLFLAMVGRDITAPAGLERAAFTIGASFVLIVLGLAAIVALLSRGRHPGRLVLQATVAGPSVTPTSANAGWLGWFGASTRLSRDVPGEASGSTRGNVIDGSGGQPRRGSNPPGPFRRIHVLPNKRPAHVMPISTFNAQRSTSNAQWKSANGEVPLLATVQSAGCRSMFNPSAKSATHSDSVIERWTLSVER